MKEQYVLTILIFILAVILGFIAITIVLKERRVEISEQKRVEPSGYPFLSDTKKGVIETINYKERFLILSTPYQYGRSDTFKIKIYFTDRTNVEKQDFLQESGVVYAIEENVQSAIEHLAVGDRIYIQYIIDHQRRQFIAEHIMHGDPFPEL